MSINVAFSALEEEILYVLYDNYLFKRSILSVESVSVSFDTSSGHLFPRKFSLVLLTNKNQPLILESSGFEALIQTFQTYKRMENDREDWIFLDEMLAELKEEMPRYVMMIEAMIQQQAEKMFASKLFLPSTMDIIFEKKEVNISYEDMAPSEAWTKAWNRFAHHRKSYLAYIGFKGESLEQILNLPILHLEEIEAAHEHVDEGVTQYRATIGWNEKEHTFSFYKGYSPTFETHMYVDSVFDMEALYGYIKPNPSGKSLGEFFGMEAEKGFDFEKLWKRFLTEEMAVYEQSLERFKEEKRMRNVQEATSKIGLVVKDAYVEEETHVIVLEDGSVFKKA